MTARVYDPADYVEPILDAFTRATDDIVARGRAWYPDAQAEAEAIGDASGVGAERAAAIIAALSPRNRWTRNLADALNVAMARGSADHAPCGTFGSNVTKARLIAREHTPWRLILRGPKVEAFVANVSGADPTAVTVDVWAMRAATRGERHAPRNVREYEAVAEAYRRAAEAMGERPCDFQAIVWIVTREAGIGQVDRRTGERRVNAVEE